MGQVRERGIDRAIQVLECLHLARRPLAIGEIARRLEAPRSTVYDIANRFVLSGILELSDSDRKVFFGRTLYFYAADYLDGNELLRRARNEVDRLADVTGETTEFCVLHGKKYTIAYMRAGAKLFRISSEVGVRLPIPWTASGRLLLANMTTQAIQDLIPPEDFVLPGGQSIDVNNFYADILKANQDGYCVTSGLVDSFTKCIAVPVRDRQGAAVATLCCVVTTDEQPARVSGLIQVLKDSAQRLSTEPAARVVRGTALGA